MNDRREISIEKVLRTNGILFAACAILVTAGYVLHPPTADHMHTERWGFTHLFLLIPLALFPLLLTGLYVPRMHAAGRIGLVGYVLAVLGLIFVFGLDYVETFLNPVLAVEEPDWVARHGAGDGVGWIAIVFPLSALAFGVGTILLFAGLRRAGDLPRAPLGISMLAVFPMLAGAYFPATVIGVVGPAVFGIAMASIGVHLAGSARRPAILACVATALLSSVTFALTADDHAANAEDHGAMHCCLVEVDPQHAPTLELVVHEDPHHGWNVELRTTNFTFAPHEANEDHVPGHGHAHLAIDGLPHTRVYGNWFYIPHLPPGEHEISVSLNTNDHQMFAVDGVPVTRTVRLPVSRD